MSRCEDANCSNFTKDGDRHRSQDKFEKALALLPLFFAPPLVVLACLYHQILKTPKSPVNQFGAKSCHRNCATFNSTSDAIKSPIKFAGLILVQPRKAQLYDELYPMMDGSATHLERKEPSNWNFLRRRSNLRVCHKSL